MKIKAIKSYSIVVIGGDNNRIDFNHVTEIFKSLITKIK